MRLAKPLRRVTTWSCSAVCFGAAQLCAVTWHDQCVRKRSVSVSWRCWLRHCTVFRAVSAVLQDVTRVSVGTDVSEELHFHDIRWNSEVFFQDVGACLPRYILEDLSIYKYKVVQIWPGQTVTCLHTISPGHIWTTLYIRIIVRQARIPHN